MQTENGVKPLGSVEAWLCSADLSAKANHLVTHNGATGVALTDTAYDSIAGLILNGAASAARADVRPWIPGGVYKVWVSAAVADAAKLQIDTGAPGQLVTQTTGRAVAQALEASSGAGIIRVRAMATDGAAPGLPAPTAYNATATLTAADLVSGLISSTGVTGPTILTTPTGTLLTAAAPHVPIGGSFEFVVINTGTGASTDVTLAAGTDVTLSGNPTVGSLTDATIISGSGIFRAKRTAATTWTIYRAA